jgi:hypothetical protein
MLSQFRAAFTAYRPRPSSFIVTPRTHKTKEDAVVRVIPVNEPSATFSGSSLNPTIPTKDVPRSHSITDFGIFVSDIH